MGVMYSLLTTLLRPTVLLFLLAVLGVANLWRKPGPTRRRLLLATVPLGLLLACSLPAVALLAMGSLEWQYRPLKQRPADAQAIVVLSGYVQPPAAGQAHWELGEDTLARCFRAAELYHEGSPCPVVVSGGKVSPADPGPLMAPLMRDFLVGQGVCPDDVIVEDQARTTHENAINSCKLLRERGIEKVILVTDAAHMLRAAGCFEKEGVAVVPCGCRHRTLHFDGRLEDFLPSGRALVRCDVVAHEWLGVLWYKLQGRM